MGGKLPSTEEQCISLHGSSREAASAFAFHRQHCCVLNSTCPTRHLLTAVLCCAGTRCVQGAPHEHFTGLEPQQQQQQLPEVRRAA